MEGQINAQLHTNVIIFHKRLVTSQFGRFLLRYLQTTLGPNKWSSRMGPTWRRWKKCTSLTRDTLNFSPVFFQQVCQLSVSFQWILLACLPYMILIIFFSLLGTRGACSINKGVDTMSIVHQMDSQSCRYHISRQISVFLFLAIDRKRSGILSQEKYIYLPSKMGPLSWVMCTQIRLNYNLYYNCN